MAHRPNNKEGKTFPSCKKPINAKGMMGRKNHHFVIITAKADTGKDNGCRNQLGESLSYSLFT